MTNQKRSGGCLCGQFTYTIDEEAVVSAFHCHCLDCQKSTGSGKATIIVIPEKNLQAEGELKYLSLIHI